MKLKHIINEWVKANQTSGNYDFNETVSDDSFTVTAYKRDEKSTKLGFITVDQKAITNLEADAGDFHHVATDLIAYICSKADKANQSMSADMKSFEDIKIRNALVSAGFKSTDDDILVRTPHSAPGMFQYS